MFRVDGVRGDGGAKPPLRRHDETPLQGRTGRGSIGLNKIWLELEGNALITSGRDAILWYFSGKNPGLRRMNC